MYGGFSRSVFGSVSGRSSPESVSEDLAEPSSGFRDKFATSLGGNNVNRGREPCQIYEQGIPEQHPFRGISGFFFQIKNITRVLQTVETFSNIFVIITEDLQPSFTLTEDFK